MNLDKTIFREYDIRGTVDKNFTEEVLSLIGKAYALMLKDKTGKPFENLQITIAYDARTHSPRLTRAITDSILSSGISVIELGMTTTPALYFSLFNLDVDGGIMITGSHNPPEYNGLKVCIGKETIYGEEIQKLREIAEDILTGRTTPPEGASGKRSSYDILKDYKAYMIEQFKSIQPCKVKVVIDSGNGCAGLVVPDILRGIGCSFIELFSKPDGRFPNHHPDPTIPKNLKDLIEKVREAKADVGIAYDGDADRIGVVDEKGEIIWGDKLTTLFARGILEEHPGATIIGEVKCSQTMYEDIKKHGGRAIMWKTGHSLLKKKMKVEHALLAGEMSGHIFFADRYFGYDDAVYASLRLIEILNKKKPATLSEILSDIPKLVSTPEIRLPWDEKDKFNVIERLKTRVEKDEKLQDKIKETVTVDGIRVIFTDGWGLVRASNTQPVLVLRFEASTEKQLEFIKENFMRLLETERKNHGNVS